MKNLFKTALSSMVGTLLAFGFIFFLVMGIVAASLISESGEWDEELTAVKDRSVLTLRLDGPLKDHVTRRGLVSSVMNANEPPMSGLYEITRVLKAASQDSQIKGLLLRFENFQSGMANAEALRREVAEFKKSGKFVISYAETYSELAYFVATAGDEVLLYPKGFFEWDGLFSKISYFKNTLKKLDVVPQIFRVGKYKSAIEPYTQEQMSVESREQISAILNQAWLVMLEAASEKTKISSEELNRLANENGVIYAKKALDLGFVNALASNEELEDKLLALTEVSDKPHYVSWRAYQRLNLANKNKNKKNKIALVFAEGTIKSVGDDHEEITSQAFTETLAKIRRDDDIKAVVIRVNSPGGSALASDVIWTSTQWLKDKKPVVTSFGNVAASGGYYMSAGSQYLFSERTTITGSIGVFGLSFATQKFFNDKIGMTFDTAKSHNYSDLESLERELTPQERGIMQGLVENIYEDFLSVVTQGRKALKNREEAHQVAQGRVWIGADAIQLGLVDEIGGMEQALVKAAELAELKDYDVEVYPKEPSALEEFMKQFGEIQMSFWQSVLPQSMMSLIQENSKPWTEKAYTRLPYDIIIESNTL